MAFLPRHIEKFENIAGTLSVNVPIFEVEWESGQPLRAPRSQLLGASYGFDMLGTNPALFDFGAERVRCLLYEGAGPSTVDTSLDDLMSDLWSMGLCKIYTIDSAGARRWAYGRMQSMPTISWRGGDVLSKGLALDFLRLSPWLGTTAITHTETVTSSPDTFTVNNPGNLPATIVEIRLRANANPGFTNPKIENLTAVNTPFGSVLYTFETARDGASSNDEVRLFTGSPAEAASVKRSTDNGSSYADDFAQLVIGTAHRVLAFALAPGDNSIKATIGGTANVDVQITAYAAYA
ncbi:MAG: hypothetical protein AB7P33_17075 [Dehalococcoidia bacterium]